MAGKGSKPRPVSKQKYDVNYDNIFRKKEKSKESCPECHININMSLGEVFQKMLKCSKCSVEFDSDPNSFSYKFIDQLIKIYGKERIISEASKVLYKSAKSVVS